MEYKTLVVHWKDRDLATDIFVDVTGAHPWHDMGVLAIHQRTDEQERDIFIPIREILYWEVVK